MAEVIDLALMDQKVKNAIDLTVKVEPNNLSNKTVLADIVD